MLVLPGLAVRGPPMFNWDHLVACNRSRTRPGRTGSLLALCVGSRVSRFASRPPPPCVDSGTPQRYSERVADTPQTLAYPPPPFADSLGGGPSTSDFVWGPLTHPDSGAPPMQTLAPLPMQTPATPTDSHVGPEGGPASEPEGAPESKAEGARSRNQNGTRESAPVDLSYVGEFCSDFDRLHPKFAKSGVASANFARRSSDSVADSADAARCLPTLGGQVLPNPAKSVAKSADEQSYVSPSKVWCLRWSECLRAVALPRRLVCLGAGDGSPSGTSHWCALSGVAALAGAAPRGIRVALPGRHHVGAVVGRRLGRPVGALGDATPGGVQLVHGRDRRGRSHGGGSWLQAWWLHEAAPPRTMRGGATRAL